MTKLKTDDCRNWLATDSGIQQLVKDRYGWDADQAVLLERCDYDQGDVDYINDSVKKGIIPKNWKRQAKYTAGSKRDMEYRQYGSSQYGSPTAGIIREFSLDGTEILVVILEKDGVLSFLDDLSD